MKINRDNLDSLSEKVSRGLLWATFGTGMTSLLSMLILMVLARLITPSEFGIVNAALVITSISIIFSQVGVGPAIIQCKHLESNHLTTGFMFSLILSFSITSIIYLFSSIISRFFKMEGLKEIVQILSLTIIFDGASVVARSLLQRELKFRSIAEIELISYFVGYGMIGIGLAFIKLGVWALVIAHITQSVLNCSLLLMLQPHPKIAKIEKRVLKELLHFGGGFTLASIFNYFARNGDYMIVGRFLGSEALGLYSRAFKLMATPATIFAGVMDRVLFPTMSKIQKEILKLSNAYNLSIAAVSLISLPLAAFMFVLAPEIVILLLGEKWVGAIVPFKILSLGTMFRASYKISECLARAKGAVYKIAFSHFIYALLIVIGAFVGQAWGIVGVSWGVLIALGGVFSILTFISLNLVSLSIRSLTEHIPGLILAIIFFVEISALAEFLRAASLPPFVIIIIGASVVAFTALVLFRINKLLFFGKSGASAVKAFSDYLLKRFNGDPILRKILSQEQNLKISSGRENNLKDKQYFE